MNNSLFSKNILARWMTLWLTVLIGACAPSFLIAEETNAPAASAETPRDNAETLRSFLLLQEQIHATQLSLERNRQETEAMAAQNAALISAKLEAIEKTLAAQRDKEFEAVQSSNRLLLIVGGSLAGLSFVALLLTAYLQWRSVNRLAEFAAMLPVSRKALPAGESVEAPMINTTSAAESNARLFGALSELEKRIHELENTARTPLTEKNAGAESPIASSPETEEAPAKTESNGVDSTSSNGETIEALLAKGQKLLDESKLTEALACFERILSKNPNHAEAWVKKGSALEHLRRIDEALKCYETAIAANPSMTVAYLYKGGLCNRLERFNEALECYEAALRSQEKAEKEFQSE